MAKSATELITARQKRIESSRGFGKSATTGNSLVDLLKETAHQWSRHKIFQLSAALAYYSIFSLAPLLVIAVAVAGWALGPDAVTGQLRDQLQGMMGPKAAETVQSMVQNAYQPGKGTWATVIGVVALVLGASTVFGQLKDALNTIWDVSTPEHSGILAFIRDRSVSFGFVLVVGFLLLASLLLTALVAGAWEFLSSWVPLPKGLLTVAGILVSMGVNACLFATIYRWLPDLHIEWKHAWKGAFFTAALFELGKVGLAVYLGRQSASSTYGAAGAVILVLLWIYYTSAIFLTGATFTRACRDKCAAC
jgi:membrane protein